MYLSRNWLNDYVNIAADSKELSDKISLTGLEVESFENLLNVEGLVVGKVISITKHPEADKLNVTQVDIGNEVLQIVCGAPNVVSNALVIVAKVGTKLPELEIKSATIRGVESNGMLCALQEIGLDEKFVAETYKQGIFLFEGVDVKVGQNPIEILCLNDEVLDISITPNRSDALSMFGLAYEIGAIYSTGVTIPKVREMQHNNWIDIKLKSKNCPVYFAGLAKNIVIKPSPLWMQAILIANNIRPISNVVDITNFVMLETGQPLHAFDFETLQGDISVSQATSGQVFVTLDGKERKLEESDVVVCDARGPIALAGVMGGLETEVTSDTKQILIESAFFDAVAIRKTSNKFNLRSEASLRFEKIIDPEMSIYAMKRALDLLEQYADAEIENTYSKSGEIPNFTKEITISTNFIQKKLGFEITTSSCVELLQRLQLDVVVSDDTICVSIPSRRHEMSIKEDIVEEIGRLYGFDNIPEILPKLDSRVAYKTPTQQVISTVTNALLGKGYTEFLTYSLVSENESTICMIGQLECEKSYAILSPLSDERSYFRKSQLPGAMSAINYNISRQQRNIKGFEFTQIHTFQNNQSDVNITNTLSIFETGEITEKSVYEQSTKASFYTIQKNVRALLHELGVQNITFSVNDSEYLQPGMRADIIVNNKVIGVIGKIHPMTAAQFQVKESVFYAEINIDDINVDRIEYKPVSKFPKVERDLAFLIDKNYTGQQLIDAIKSGAQSELLQNIEVFDVYENEKLGKDMKSLSVKLVFESHDKTLSTNDVDNVVEAIITNVENVFQTTFRR